MFTRYLELLSQHLYNRLDKSAYVLFDICTFCVAYHCKWWCQIYGFMNFTSSPLVRLISVKIESWLELLAIKHLRGGCQRKTWHCNYILVTVTCTGICTSTIKNSVTGYTWVHGVSGSTIYIKSVKVAYSPIFNAEAMQLAGIFAFIH